MQLMRVSFGVGVVLLVAGAAMAQKVTTDYEKSTDFSGYKTFKWIKEPKTANPLMGQRVIEEVNAVPAADGDGAAAWSDRL